MRSHRRSAISSSRFVQKRAFHLLHDQIEEQVRQVRVQRRLELERHPEIDHGRLGNVPHTRTESPIVEQIVEQKAFAALRLDQKRLIERQLAAIALNQRRKADHHFGVCLRWGPIEQDGFLAVRNEVLVVVHVGDDIVHLLHRVAECHGGGNYLRLKLQLGIKTNANYQIIHVPHQLFSLVLLLLIRQFGEGEQSSVNRYK